MEWFSKLQEINSILILIFGGGFSFFGGLIVRLLIKRTEIRAEEKELVNKRLKSLEYSNVAILHNKIYRQCADHLSDGFISIDDLDELGYLFKAYKNLGGNGTGETLYNKVKELPNIKKEGIKDE
ncbi:hypothetical protein [Vagococcus lutrae]|uniref:hypothetical protein n=1 Tax=Vagococcus lutrae TaxID=81947 RepID=UPI0028909D82|nr:hypothetical protein [Vagococcus lutrae]MDT2824341.1 hypothetical protein [Vagococcus lutrae]